MSNVLVVDDNKGNRHLAKILLKSEGHTVLEAGNINVACEVLEAQPVDLIVADVLMPGGGGFELYERLRGGPHAATPVLMMTAAMTPDAQERARQNPGVRLVDRPIDPDDYVTLINSAIPKKS